MPLCGRRTWSGQADAGEEEMAEIVNLRQARKRKRRADDARAADENRVIHGQPAAETIARRRAEALKEKRLDGHRRDPHDAQE